MVSELARLGHAQAVGRTEWFRLSARAVLGTRSIDALGLSADDLADGELARLAAAGSWIAQAHAVGAPLGHLLEQAEQIPPGGVHATAFGLAVYEHFRGGLMLDDLSWEPGDVLVGMLSWMLATSEDAPDARALRLGEEWPSMPDELADDVIASAARWQDLEELSFCERHPVVLGIVEDDELHERFEALGDHARRARHLLGLEYDLVVLRALEDRPAGATPNFVAQLRADIEERVARLTVFETALLARLGATPEALGWARHRGRLPRIGRLRAPSGGTYPVVNPVCETLDDVSLIPVWLEDQILNGGALAGFARSGPTAHVWAIADDADPVTLRLDLDVAPGVWREGRPPPIVFCWRDATRKRLEDWSTVSLMLQDDPDSWGWLALAALTGRVIMDALSVSPDGEIAVVARGMAIISGEEAAQWAATLPAPPENLGAYIDRMASDHALGGFQAAERSKSAALLELGEDLRDTALREARRQVLEAEEVRALQHWAGEVPDDQPVDDGWARLREMRAWKNGLHQSEPVEPARWLRGLISGVATERRAVVHLMVTEGLQLFWAAEGEDRYGFDVLEEPVQPLLDALAPWQIGASLTPGAAGDPVEALVAAAGPVGDVLFNLAEREGFDHLVLIPWRGLHSVPWHAVRLSGGGRLSDRVRLTHAPALGLLRRVPGRRTRGRGAVAIAAHGQTLKHADGEIELVAALHRGVIVRDGTSPGQIIEAMGSAAIVHIAGHAGAAPYPLASAVLGGNGSLASSQVTTAARLHLEADLQGCDLVVINACDSGRYAPEPRSFENHTGFDTACLAAGATAVISTLWPVYDPVAVIVAATLHHGLVNGRTPSDALDSAMHVLRDGLGAAGVPAAVHGPLDELTAGRWRRLLDDRAEDLQHPYFWAPWRISGADWLLDGG